MQISIRNKNLRAVIGSRGAQLLSLKDASGTEYIWQRNPDIWKNSAPVLFPIVGALRNGSTLIAGRSCRIEKHGGIQNAEFEIVHCAEDAAELLLSDAGYADGGYPYHACLTVRFRLLDGFLILEADVKNCEAVPIAYCIGFHPGFCCPIGASERFEDYSICFSERETRGYFCFDTVRQQFDRSRAAPFPGSDGQSLPLSRALFLNDAIWFDELASRKAALCGPDGTPRVAVSFPDFSGLALWTLPREDSRFLCIEPWNGSGACLDEDDEFLHKNHLQRLPPGERRTYRMAIGIGGG